MDNPTLLRTKNFAPVDLGQPPPFVPDVDAVNPYNFIRPLNWVLVNAGLMRDKVFLNIARPSLIRITGLAGPATGPGLTGTVDCPMITVTARGGQGSASATPVTPFYTSNVDLCLRANRGYLYLPFAGPWTIEVTAIGNVVPAVLAVNPWIVSGYLLEGYSPYLYSALVAAPPFSGATVQSAALAANEQMLLQFGGGAGFNDCSLKTLKLTAPAAGWTYSIGSGTLTSAQTIATTPASTVLTSDELPLCQVRVNAPAGGGTIKWAATLDG